jgi:hypothetical protein
MDMGTCCATIRLALANDQLNLLSIELPPVLLQSVILDPLLWYHQLTNTPMFLFPSVYRLFPISTVSRPRLPIGKR